MKALLVVLLASLCLSGCFRSEEPVAVRSVESISDSIPVRSALNLIDRFAESYGSDGWGTSGYTRSRKTPKYNTYLKLGLVSTDYAMRDYLTNHYAGVPQDRELQEDLLKTSVGVFFRIEF